MMLQIQVHKRNYCNELSSSSSYNTYFGSLSLSIGMAMNCWHKINFRSYDKWKLKMQIKQIWWLLVSGLFFGNKKQVSHKFYFFWSEFIEIDKRKQY